MAIKYIGNYKFIVESFKEIQVVYSCASGDLNFNKNSIEGLKNLNNIKKWFNVTKVVYLNQVHGDIIRIYDEINKNNFIGLDGDAIISKERGIAFGVFTADCMPVFVMDKGKKLVAAIHSGWRGTFNIILYKTIKSMLSNYNSKVEDLLIYIGPHIGSCCYEVGKDLIDKFNHNKIYKNEVVKNNKLDLTLCIKKQCIELGVDLKNIITKDFCTYCNGEDYFSYRKNKTSNRMFSFIVIRN